MDSRTGLDGAIASFYSKTDLIIDYIPRREFGFKAWGESQGVKNRHWSFETTDQLQEYLQHHTPAGAFASQARYLDPGYRNPDPEKSNMVNKEYLCSDLAFDLDFTDLPGAADRSYIDNLQQISNHTKRLIDGFLITDFGIDLDNLLISFSGGKGFMYG